MLDLVQRGVLDLSFDLTDEAKSVSHLLHKYRDATMSLADACLVRMTELLAEGVILTLDSDFGLYRKNGHQVISTITPN